MLPQFVTRRGETLYYRRAFPQELWSVTGKGAFAMSLRTADPKEALRARPEAERRYTERIDAARAELARRKALPLLTKADAEAIAVRWYLAALDTADDFAFLVVGPEEAAKAVEDSEWAEAEARRALAEGDLADKKRLARCLREEAGFASEPIADDALVRLLGRAAIAAQQVHSRRLRGDYGARPKDPLFAAAMDAPRGAAPVAPKAAPERTIEALIAAYRKAKLAGVAPATEHGYAPVFRLLRDVLGDRAALSSLTHEEGERLFEAVTKLPLNAEKRAELRGLPVPAQIAEGKKLGLPTLAPKTINDRYMANLGALFRFAIGRGWMERNPVQGLRAREVVGDADKRDAFGDRLKVLFAAPPWTPQDPTGGGKPIRYWGPLLALFHGMRLGEIAGLELADIGDEQGQPMIYVRAGARPLKTASARRDIPLHPALVRLGFLRFVADRRKVAKPGELLFAGERAYARGQWGRALGDWFVKNVRALGLEGRKLGMHSLRHDFRDALREAEIEGSLADYLMGHAQQGVGAIYGGRPSLGRLTSAIEAVRYPGLKLPPPQSGSKRRLGKAGQ
jgi:integrase